MVADFRKKKKGPWIMGILLKLGTLVLVVLSVKMISSNAKTYREKKAVDAQVEKMESAIQNLHESNRNLQESIARTDDERYLEKVAREELDLRKPGERVVAFLDAEKQQDGGGSGNNQNQGALLPGWLRWVGELFGR